MTISIPEESSEVVRKTLQKEKNRLKEKLNSLNQKLSTYEEKTGLSSKNFQTQFDNGELGDEQIYFEWYADLETHNRIKERLMLLEKVKLDD